MQQPLLLLRLLFEHGANPNVTGGRDGSPLQAAAVYQSIETVQFLLDLGADLNFIGESEGGTAYGSPLANAAHGCEVNLGRFMLEKGAQVNARDGIYANPLQAALSGCGDRKGLVVRILLEAGADPDVEPKYRRFLEQAQAGDDDIYDPELVSDLR
ncbi:MAG: hypothetical protein Q9212_003844 [Teloschistes hypoglaucus]